MPKPRMALRDVCADMRLRGMSMSQKSLADGIALGAFPFGTVLSVSDTGVRNILILRKDYEAWADEYLGPIPQRRQPDANLL